jgi:hypothetical protein
MSESKPTPGPWWYDAENNAVYDTASNVIIVYEGQLQFKSDGPLIAAAPETAAERDRLKALNAELLEVLKRFRTKVYNAAIANGMDDEWATEACSLADAAIAKASGDVL